MRLLRTLIALAAGSCLQGCYTLERWNELIARNEPGSLEQIDYMQKHPTKAFRDSTEFQFYPTIGPK
jgi:hypothetical protein